MRNISPIIFILLFLIKKEANAQLVTVSKSDTLNIYTNNDGENIKPSVCLLKFQELFDDSVVVYLNNKRVFSKLLKPDSSISTHVDLTAPYIKLPLKNKKAELKIVLLNEKIIIKSQLLKSYRYLYVSKLYKVINLYYRNKEQMIY